MRPAVAAAATLTTTALAAALTVAPTTAKPIDKGHFHETETNVYDCATNDLPVREVSDLHVNFLLNQRGSSPFPYGRESVRGSFTWTNLLNGGTFTNVLTANRSDHKIVDNGDGTITIDMYASGGSRYYDNAGHLVLKDPGSIRFQLLIDYNGTPGDPEDDVDLDFNVIRESTGRTDTNGRDFCNDVLIFSAA